MSKESLEYHPFVIFMKVAIVEDQVLYQRYLSDIVEKDLNYEVVLCTGSASEALEKCQTSGAQLLILDLKIDGIYGLELAESLLDQVPKLKILTYSGEINAYNLRTVVALEIKGYLDKSDPAMKDDQYLIDAIHKVANGERIFSPSIQKLWESMAQDEVAFHKILSPKKIAILKLIAKCMTDDEIAMKLDLSIHTVRKHRTAMMKYLGQDSTHSLIRYAQQNGFSN